MLVISGSVVSPASCGRELAARISCNVQQPTRHLISDVRLEMHPSAKLQTGGDNRAQFLPLSHLVVCGISKATGELTDAQAMQLWCTVLSVVVYDLGCRRLAANAGE